MYKQRSLYDGDATEVAFVDDSFRPVPQEVSMAAISGRPLDFYLACRNSDYIPADDLAGMYEQGAFEYEQEQEDILKRFSSSGLEESVAIVEPKPVRKGRRSNGRTKINYDTFGRLVNNAVKDGINIDNIFADTEIKRRIFIKSGYTCLKGAKGERVTIESATPSRLGTAFKNTYHTWQRKL